MDNKNPSGAVRSADTDLFSWTSLPMLGLIGVARTAAEGQTKYGRLNYKQGMPVHQYIDHAFHHLALFMAGDRTQPNLEHAAWGILAAIESDLLHPELNAPHLLGPGSTLTPEVLAKLAADAPGLAAKRKAGEFAHIGNWRLADVPDVKKILDTRAVVQIRAAGPFADADDDALTLEMVDFLRDGTIALAVPEIPADVQAEIEAFAAGMVADERCVANEQAFCAGDCCSRPATPEDFQAAEPKPFNPRVFMEAGYGPSQDIHDSLLTTEGQVEKFRAGLEKKLEVTPADMELFEGTKLKPDSPEDRARRLRIGRTDAAAYEAKLAAGWAIATDKAGTEEVHRFRREPDGKMTLVGHVVKFPDGSKFDRLTELAIPDSAPEDSRGGSAALYRKIHVEEEARRLADATITIPDEYTTDDRQRDIDNQMKADASYAEWVASKAQEELASLANKFLN